MIIRCIAEREIKENQYLWESIEDPVIQERLETNLKWFIRKAVTNKYHYYCLTASTIICPVVSGICMDVGLDGDANIVKILSKIFLAVSTISASLLTMLESKKKWGLYRNQAEQMKCRIAIYKSVDKNEKELLEIVESDMAKTQERWKSSFEKDT